MRASEHVLFLKIEGFSGKFQISICNVGEQSAVVLSSPGQPPVKGVEKIKPSDSFKLKKAFEETAKTERVFQNMVVEEQKILIHAQDAFDVPMVEQQLDEYIRIYQPERTVVVALKAHKPKIMGNEIVIEIDNNLQMERLETLKMSLQNGLMKKLNNGLIQLSFKLYDDTQNKEEKKVYITSQDKFNHFVDINPVIGEMKKIFGLELE